MINVRLPLTVCGKSVIRLQQDYFTSIWNTFSVCLFRSAEITEAISFALHSASHGFEDFSRFTGFLTTPNGQNLTRL